MFVRVCAGLTASATHLPPQSGLEGSHGLAMDALALQRGRAKRAQPYDDPTPSSAADEARARAVGFVVTLHVRHPQPAAEPPRQQNDGDALFFGNVQYS